MIRLSALTILLCLVQCCLCVFDDEIFKVDWQYTVLGNIVPGTVSFDEDTVSFLTDESVFAKVNLTNGEPVWRFQSETPFEDGKLVAVSDLIYTAFNYATGSRITSWNGNAILNEIDLPELTVGLFNLRNEDCVAVTSSGKVIFVNDATEISTGLVGTTSAKVSLLSTGEIVSVLDVAGSKTTVVVLKKVDGTYMVISKFFISKPYNQLKELVGDKLITNDEAMQYDAGKATFIQIAKCKNAKMTAFASDTLFCADNSRLWNRDTSIDFLHEAVRLETVDSQFLVVFGKDGTTLIDADDELWAVLAEYPAVDLKHAQQVYTRVSDSTFTVLVESADSVLSLWTNGTLTWSRDESLAKVVDWTIVDEESDLEETAHDLELEESSNLLDAYVFRARKNYNKLRAAYKNWGKQTENLDHYFGFAKTLVVATANGKVFGFATETKRLKWSLDTHLGDKIAKLTVADNVLLITTTDDEVYVVKDHASFPLDFAISSEEPILDPSFKEQHVFATGLPIVSKDSLPVYLVAKARNSVSGVILREDSKKPTWSHQFGKDETVLSISSRAETNENVASIGIVLGSRKVIYKYLVPDLVVVTTYDYSAGVLYLYLMNAVTGQVLYTTKQTEALDPSTVHVIYDENFIIYSYYSTETKLVVLDLFESLTPDVRRSGEFTPEVSSLGFVIAGKIRDMIQTQTKQNIASKSIVLAMEDGQIVSVPKFVLNSRRVVDRDLTREEQEEFRLITYGPAISMGDHFVLTHYRTILNSHNSTGRPTLRSVPTNLESTTLVCSVDLDIFCTRLAPSNTFDVLSPSFDRAFLLATIGALVLALVVIRPIVNAKKLRAAWVI